MRRAAALAWLLLSGLAAPAAAQRLPQTALPDHYDIHLSPDFTTNGFRGEETIAVRLVEPALIGDDRVERRGGRLGAGLG